MPYAVFAYLENVNRKDANNAMCRSNGEPIFVQDLERPWLYILELLKREGARGAVLYDENSN